MNCKPGDLAVVVRTADYAKHCLGRVVTVLRLHPEYGHPGWECWEYEPPLHIGGHLVKAVEDQALRPIRDPGDDAVDEVIQRIGTPHKEVA